MAYYMHFKASGYPILSVGSFFYYVDQTISDGKTLDFFSWKETKAPSFFGQPEIISLDLTDAMCPCYQCHSSAYPFDLPLDNDVHLVFVSLKFFSSFSILRLVGLKISRGS